MRPAKKPVGRRLVAPKPKRHEATPADYRDEISDSQIEEIKRVAASKDSKDENWETISGPAW